MPLTDADRARWLIVRDEYQAARKLAAACIGADAGDDVCEAATRTLLEHFRASGVPAATMTAPAAPAPVPVGTPAASASPLCPKCGAQTEAVVSSNPKAPAWRCVDRSCDTGIWPGRKNGR